MYYTFHHSILKYKIGTTFRITLFCTRNFIFYWKTQLLVEPSVKRLYNNINIKKYISIKNPYILFGKCNFFFRF